MSTRSAHPVATALARSAKAVFPWASASAMIPEPTTATRRKAVPTPSATARAAIPRLILRGDHARFHPPSLDRQAVELLDRQSDEGLHSRFEAPEGIAKRHHALD